MSFGPPDAFMRALANGPPPATPGPKRGKEAMPEPTGKGLRVVLQRLSVTRKDLLEVPFLFQCPPLESFPRAYSWSFTDYDTVGAGMHSRPGSTDLATITFRSLFVEAPAPFVVKKGTTFNPVYLAERLKALGDAKTPFQLLAGQPDLWGVFYDVNMAVTMRSLDVEERAGEPDARYFTVSFKEFRGVSPSELTAGLRSNLQTATGDKVLAILTVRNLPVGMRTFRAIAKRYYGSSAPWRLIAKASGLSVAGDVNLVARYANMIPSPKVVVPALKKGA